MQIRELDYLKEYSFSLWFDRENKYEYILFGDGEEKEKFFNGLSTDNDKLFYEKRNFGKTIIEAILLKNSEDFDEIKRCIKGLLYVLKKGDGKDKSKKYEEKLFEMYDNTSNIIEKYIILAIEYCFLHNHKRLIIGKNKEEGLLEQFYKAVVHLELYKKESVDDFKKFTDNILYPIEFYNGDINDIDDICDNVFIRTLKEGKERYLCYTWISDWRYAYFIYLMELSNKKKIIKKCEICEQYFIASRSHQAVCNDKCKRQRQLKYNDIYKEKMKDNRANGEFQIVRNRYDNFVKKLRKNNISEDIIDSYIKVKRDFLAEGKIKSKKLKKNILTEEEFLDWVKVWEVRRSEEEVRISEILGWK